MRWIRLFALTVCLLPTTVGRADDDTKPAATGNWFAHLFVKGGAKKKENEKDEAIKPAAPSPALARQKAQFELLRRQEVCDKLRQISLETGDKDLGRKAEALEQRAWDLYVQRTGGDKGEQHADEKLLEGRISQDAVRPARASSTPAGLATSARENRTAARKDEP